MRLSSLLIGSLLTLCTTLIGCSSSDDTEAVGAAGSTQQQPEGFTPTPTGVRISEQEACEAYVAGLEAAAERLGCTMTTPLCPGFLRQSAGEACYQYDQGTVTACVAFFDEYTTCDHIATRPCIVHFYPDSQGLGCPDAGADVDAATEDATGDDALAEPEPDAAAEDDDAGAGGSGGSEA